MNRKYIVSLKDAQGRTRFYVVPIETEQGFRDLVAFVSQEFGCTFGELDKGPGTITQKTVVENKGLVFVLSDCTGIQFFAEKNEDVGLASRIADRIESRICEVMKSYDGK